MPNPLVPHGYHLPFATVSTHDHTAWILIATSLGIVYSVVFGGIRVFVRYTISRRFASDDLTLAIATVRPRNRTSYSLPTQSCPTYFIAISNYAGQVLGLVQSSVILAACHDGLGKSIENVSQSNQAKVQRVSMAIIFTHSHMRLTVRCRCTTAATCSLL